MIFFPFADLFSRKHRSIPPLPTSAKKPFPTSLNKSDQFQSSSSSLNASRDYPALFNNSRSENSRVEKSPTKPAYEKYIIEDSEEDEEEDVHEVGRVSADINMITQEVEPFIHSSQDSNFLLHLLKSVQFYRGNTKAQSELLKYLEEYKNKQAK